MRFRLFWTLPWARKKKQRRMATIDSSSGIFAREEDSPAAAARRQAALERRCEDLKDAAAIIASRRVEEEAPSHSDRRIMNFLAAYRSLIEGVIDNSRLHSQHTLYFVVDWELAALFKTNDITDKGELVRGIYQALQEHTDKGGMLAGCHIEPPEFTAGPGAEFSLRSNSAHQPSLTFRGNPYGRTVITVRLPEFYGG